MGTEATVEWHDWSGVFARERARLIEALGAMTDGGLVEQCEHVGATSVPGLVGRACLDLALAVWPFPLEEPAQHALAALGYELDHELAGAPGHRFRHASAAIRLYAIESGSPSWMDYLVLREYLRNDQGAREALSSLKRRWDGGAESAAYREAKGRWIEERLVDARLAWIEREGFAPVRRAVDELRDFDRAWQLGGGWALDLFVGQVRRIHDDVDVAVSCADQAALQRHLTAHNWTLLTPVDGRLQPWPQHMRLEPPRHQVHAHRNGAFIDFLLDDITAGVWRYRREPAIIRDASRISLRTDEGIPYLAPELVLLFKSTRDSGAIRAKDQADFEVACPMLGPERRAWLRRALTATNPDHPWLDRL
jgi:GrpB-like predicted nucleotidyltransferase (UPF0157 family)